MKTVNFATVGIGRKGRGHISEALSYPGLFKLSAICDNAPDRLENIPQSMADAKKYASLDELLTDKDVELVTIATRHLDHVPMAVKILEAGKFCLIEKPVASSVKAMNELKACADKHPGKLFLGHNRRFEPAFVKALELINSGILGTVHYIKLYRSVGYCRRNDWMTMGDFFGGLLTNWGPHLIDQALRLLDSPVVDIWSDVRRSISIGNGDDLFKIILKAQNNRLADIEVSGANTMPGREMEIICQKGTIAYEGGPRILLRMVDPSLKLADLKPHPENPPMQYGNFDETLTFVDSQYDLPKIGLSEMWKRIHGAIADGTPYPVKFQEGMEVVKVTEEVIRKSGFQPLQQFLP